MIITPALQAQPRPLAAVCADCDCPAPVLCIVVCNIGSGHNRLTRDAFVISFCDFASISDLITVPWRLPIALHSDVGGRV